MERESISISNMKQSSNELKPSLIPQLQIDYLRIEYSVRLDSESEID